MSTVTHNQAGLLAAGAARHDAVVTAGAATHAATAVAPAFAGTPAERHRTTATWLEGVQPIPTTKSMVRIGKNRPTRPLSERST